MFAHYLKIAFRALRKQSLYAVINVLGLSIGIGMCVLLFLYIQDELTYDRFNENLDRIARVTQFGYEPDGSISNEHVWHPYPLGPSLQADHPAVEQVVRMHEGEVFLRNNDVVLEQNIHFVDKPFFQVFSFPMIAGDPDKALENPASIVLSQSAAVRYFGTTDVLDRTMDIRYEDSFESVTITGVMADVPGNSSLPFDVIMPFEQLPLAFDWIRNRTSRWNASSFYTFALLREGTDIDQANSVLASLRQKYYPNEIQQAKEAGRWELDSPVRGYRFQPMADIHLDTDVQGGFVPASDPMYSYILGSIALGILLLACINFTTLSIGRSASRAPEIGLRKAVGALRGQIMYQFGGEALMFGLMGSIGAVVVAKMLLPILNSLSGKALSFDLLASPILLLAILVLGLITGLIAGAYPSFVLARLRPGIILQRRARLGGSGILTRTLVVCQFVLSIGLISGTFIMLQQMRFVRNADLGYNQKNVVVVKLNDVPYQRVVDRFESDLSARPDIIGMTGVSQSFNQGFSQVGWTYKEQEKTAYEYNVMPSYLDVMEIDLVAGRNFDPLQSTDATGSVLVNEALVADFGWTPQEALGQPLEGIYDSPRIVGVVEDIRNRSLHEEVHPMFMTGNPDEWILFLLVRIDTENAASTIAAMEESWKAVAPDVNMEYSFMDDDLARFYQNESRWSRIVGYSAILSVLIACLGLFGLAALAVEGRTREIGIRRVLGATSAAIFRLLTRDYLVLVLIASVVAVPLAYLGTQKWLESFAYRIDTGMLGFVLAIFATIVVAVGVVSYQSIRASNSNPIDSLRCE